MESAESPLPGESADHHWPAKAVTSLRCVLKIIRKSWSAALVQPDGRFASAALPGFWLGRLAFGNGLCP
jgi:hypothetical protein